jgi:hypothetical protein
MSRLASVTTKAPMVAVRHELLIQLRADRRLIEMGSNTFTRRCVKYGIGESSRENRPEGQSAVTLNELFVADLVSDFHDPNEAEEFGSPRKSQEKTGGAKTGCQETGDPKAA